MPVSKRDKKVSLTKTSKKGMAMKQQLVEEIRKFLDKYDNLYVFTINNMRNGPLKDLREEWKDSRFFFAKRKVMAIALGRTEAEEIQKNIHKLASHLVGQCGLLFTNRPKDQVVEWFQNYSQMEFAKSGFAATETVTLPAGPLPEFSFALEPHLRSLGLPTQLEKGKIILRENYTVCTQGAKLTPEQASILKLIGQQMAEFKIKIVCMWSKDGSFERFKVPKAAKQLTSENNTELQKKKKKKKSNIQQENRKTEEEITHLFGQQTINECDHEKGNTHSVEKKESRVSDPANKKLMPTQLEMEDEIMNEECEEPPKSEEVSTSMVIKSTKKKSKKAVRAETEGETVNEETEKLTQNEEIEECTNMELGKKKSLRNDQAESEEKVPTKESEELAEELEHLEKLKPNNESPKITRENPRRSMRTPKPIRRSPAEKKQSIKKLTESNKKTKSAVKDKVTKPARNTPRKSVSKRIFEEPDDVEMAE